MVKNRHKVEGNTTASPYNHTILDNGMRLLQARRDRESELLVVTDFQQQFIIARSVQLWNCPRELHGGCKLIQPMCVKTFGGSDEAILYDDGLQSVMRLDWIVPGITLASSVNPQPADSIKFI